MIRRYELPYPPSVNHYWRHVGSRVLISREGRAYRRTVVLDLAVQHSRATCFPLRVRVLAYPPDRRKRDLDNILKALLDALEHAGVYGDDSQINTLSITRCEVVPGGKVIVELEPYDEDQS